MPAIGESGQPPPTDEKFIATIQAKLTQLNRIAGLDMPPYMGEWHRLTYAALCRKPPPDPLLALTTEGGAGRDWHKAFYGVTIVSLTESLIACSYHAQNICQLESAVVTTASQLYQGTLQPGTALGGGNIRRIEFEYHAFVFAYRRSWEYLGRAVGFFFKQNIRSVKDFQSESAAQRIRTSPRGKELPDVADKVVRLIQTLLKEDAGSFSSEHKRSVRDRLAHYEHVSAGTLNVTNTGEGLRVALFGGGEELRSLLNVDGSGQTGPIVRLGTKLLSKGATLAHNAGRIYAAMRIIDYDNHTGRFTGIQ
jgi:hypothetical protein